ncbi:uncharacterized protein EV422DRAFT_503557 [Fimicolochytrium jonesii]|uniref:uncharacterized protein n=1 Tax=Fimicolochytrium jonesii TaxID=1396493 RepID=UPI0022FEEC42|nr:uncharacterized protein EV422DRAFT_503557 [Fimicolochytrium jonesii]KAI8826271.1 hypothetical protein EV422DRAFT_503557 [Fimicolochytrium jonesii]
MATCAPSPPFSLLLKLLQPQLLGEVLVWLDSPAIASITAACRPFKDLTADTSFRLRWLRHRGSLTHYVAQHFKTKRRDLPPDHPLYDQNDFSCNANVRPCDLPRTHPEYDPSGYYTDAFLSTYPHNLRLNLPPAIARSEAVLQILLEREKSKLTFSPTEFLTATQCNIFLAIARQAFWYGLPKLADMFLLDHNLCRRIVAATGGTPGKFEAPDGVLHSFTPFRDAAVVRRHVSLVRHILETGKKLDPILWYPSIEVRLVTTYYHHAQQPPVDMLALYLDHSRAQGESFSLYQPVRDICRNGDIRSLQLLQRHLPTLDANFLSKRLGVIVEAAQGCRELSYLANRAVKDCTRLVPYCDNDSRLAEFKDLFSALLDMQQLDDERGTYCPTLDCLLNGGSTRQYGCAPFVPFTLEIFQLALRKRPADIDAHVNMFLASFLFFAMLHMPEPIDAIQELTLPIWDGEVVSEAARITLHPYVSFRWDNVTTEDDSETFDEDDKGRRGGRGGDRLEVNKAVHRLLAETSRADLAITSTTGLHLRKMLFSRYLDKRHLKNLLPALLEAGESLREYTVPFSDWMSTYEEAADAGDDWELLRLLTSVEWLLKAGYDPRLIEPECREQFQDFGPSLQLLAKYGVAWAEEDLKNGQNDEARDGTDVGQDPYGVCR